MNSVQNLKGGTQLIEILGGATTLVAALLFAFWCAAIMGTMTPNKSFVHRIVNYGNKTMEVHPIIFSLITLLSALILLIIGSYMWGGEEAVIVILEALEQASVDARHQ